MIWVAVLGGGCATETTTTQSWGAPYGGEGWVQDGWVQYIRETVHRVDGDPAAGAVAGAALGGVVGASLGGGGIATLFGAAGGAVLGAHASQGSSEQRFYELYVQFDDGGRQVFRYEGYPPFGVGARVRAQSGALFALQ